MSSLSAAVGTAPGVRYTKVSCKCCLHTDGKTFLTYGHLLQSADNFFRPTELLFSHKGAASIEVISEMCLKIKIIGI